MSRPDLYIMIRAPRHPMAVKGGVVAEHRLVMCQKLGRLLLPDEIVHHLNGDRSDNRPENLVLTNAMEHLHVYHRRPAQAGPCASCKTLAAHYIKGMCPSCYARSRAPHPQAEQQWWHLNLMALLAVHGCRELAKLMNVSPTSIERWRRGYPPSFEPNRKLGELAAALAREQKKGGKTDDGR